MRLAHEAMLRARLCGFLVVLSCGGTVEAPEIRLQDDAALEAVDFPGTLACGTTYDAVLTMRNRGVSVWSGAGGYRLAAVGVHDSLSLVGIGAGADLEPSATVEPGRGYTFRVRLRAPLDAATIVSAWRMTKGGVEFGETVRQEVQVLCGLAVTRQATAARRSAPPTIDGDPADWREATRCAVAPSTLGATGGSSTGVDADADLSGTFALAWDDAALYVLVEAVDDAVDDHLAAPGQWLTSDGVALSFDLDADHAGTTLDDGDSTFAFVSEGAVLGRFLRRRGVAGEVTLLAPDTVRAAMRRTAGGWTLEAAIPLSVLTGTQHLLLGPTAGFTVRFLDGEEQSGAPKLLQWTGKGDDQATWGDLAFSGYLDADGDGWPAATDCRDNAPADHPYAAERAADGIDNDCDGLVDEVCAGPEVVAPALIGYGLVNHWFVPGYAEELGCALETAGLTFTQLEWNGDAQDGRGIDHTRDASEVATTLVPFVETMRQHSITTLITIMNWNGEPQRALDDAWFRGVAEAIRDQVGPERVIVEGVSEPDNGDPKAVRWQEMTVSIFAGWEVAGNGGGGRGTPEAAGYSYTDWHWCNDFDEGSVLETEAGAPAINSTDCGPVINPGPDRAKAMAQAAVARRAHMIIYDWGGDSPDFGVIEAMGQAVQGL